MSRGRDRHISSSAMRALRKQAVADVVKDLLGIGPHCARGDALSGLSLAGAKLDREKLGITITYNCVLCYQELRLNLE